MCDFLGLLFQSETQSWRRLIRSQKWSVGGCGCFLGNAVLLGLLLGLLIPTSLPLESRQTEELGGLARVCLVGQRCAAGAMMFCTTFLCTPSQDLVNSLPERDRCLAALQYLVSPGDQFFALRSQPAVCLSTGSGRSRSVLWETDALSLWEGSSRTRVLCTVLTPWPWGEPSVGGVQVNNPSMCGISTRLGAAVKPLMMVLWMDCCCVALVKCYCLNLKVL